MESLLENENKLERDTYGLFTLSESEFAISVKKIQEVVNEPENYSAVPLAPDYLLGLFNLRDMIIPVVDLSKIFNLGESKGAVEKERKIAIVEHGQFYVGLLFDKTGEVYNGINESKSDFKSNTDEARKSVAHGMLKLDQGKRMIQILDPHEILNLKNLPKSQDLGSSSSTSKNKSGLRRQCISFTVGESLCALDIDAIQEIIKIETIEETVHLAENYLGQINLRGHNIPLVDFCALLGYNKVPNIDDLSQSNNKAIIMKTEEGIFGLLVNSIENIVSFFQDDVISFPVLGGGKESMFEGCISSGGSIRTILLNANEIFTNPEIHTVIEGHSTLYKADANTDSTIAKKANKKTYITFSIKHDYALEIEEVDEVIDYKEEMISSSNLEEYFKGVINLRGDMIAVIDPRVLYNMDDKLVSNTPKILILKMNGVKYGLIVDSVDSILSVTERQKLKLPGIMYQGKEISLSEDVKEAFQIETEQKENTNKTILLLNLSSISSRVHLQAVPISSEACQEAEAITNSV